MSIMYTYKTTLRAIRIFWGWGGVEGGGDDDDADDGDAADEDDDDDDDDDQLLRLSVVISS